MPRLIARSFESKAAEIFTGEPLDDEICDTAKEKGINILVSPASSYEVAVALSRAL